MPVVFRTVGTRAVPAFLVRRSPAPGLTATERLPSVCAVLARPDGIVLIDTGPSRAQCAFPEQELGTLGAALSGLALRAEDALASQLISLGLDPANVRHVVATTLAHGHVDGARDFPNATLHATRDAWRAWERRQGRRAAARAPAPVDRLTLHTLAGPPALGFAASHDLLGDGTVLLLDARGAGPGAVAVAIKLAEGWLVHAGDACLSREECEGATPQPSRLAVARAVLRGERAAMGATFDAVRAALSQHKAVVVPSHDAATYATLPTTMERALPAAWDKPAGKAKSGQQPKREPPQRAEQQQQQRAARKDKAPREQPAAPRAAQAPREAREQTGVVAAEGEQQG